jgi:1,4-dihydroxy-2-naphthoyl-CoA hydrolase
MHHTDAAGLVYFANIFVLAHDCYESFLEQDKSVGTILEEGEILIPLVHVEADFRKSLYVSDKVSIEMSLSKKSTSSFELSFSFLNESGEVAAEARTSHVVISKSTRKPVEIPDFLATALDHL